MAAWIMGIVGAIVVTTLIDVILAEGETKKYIKGIAALLVLSAVITPLASLADKDFEFNYGEETSVPDVNDTYLNRIYLERYKGYELTLQNRLKTAGIDGVVIRIDIAYSDGQVDILNVTADVSNAVITAENKNIDINKTVVSVIKSGLKIDDSKIAVTGVPK